MTQIERIAQKYIGIPFQWGGRSMDGLDCVGLCHLFYREFDINFPADDGREYSPEWYKTEPRRYFYELLKLGQAAPMGLFKPLDLVYFSIGGIVRHTGIMIDSYRFIHARENQSICIEQLSSPWQRRLAGARRLL